MALYMPYIRLQESSDKRHRQELRERYGITEPLTNAYEICVGCTVYGETTYAGTMDLTVAEIGGKVYVVKAENMTNPG